MKRKNNELRQQIDRMEYALDCIVLETKTAARDKRFLTVPEMQRFLTEKVRKRLTV